MSLDMFPDAAIDYLIAAAAHDAFIADGGDVKEILAIEEMFGVTME